MARGRSASPAPTGMGLRVAMGRTVLILSVAPGGGQVVETLVGQADKRTSDLEPPRPPPRLTKRPLRLRAFRVCGRSLPFSDQYAPRVPQCPTDAAPHGASLSSIQFRPEKSCTFNPALALHSLWASGPACRHSPSARR